MGMLRSAARRLLRSHQNTHPIDWRGVVLSLVTAVLAALLVLETQNKAKTSAVLFAAAVGIITLMAGLSLFYLVEFFVRFVTQKARKGTARTLQNINTTNLEAVLRRATPAPGMFVSVWSDQTTAECYGLADELRDLLERCGWAVNDISHGYPFGRMARDIEIEMPKTKNDGLEELAERLNGWGYKTIVIPKNDEQINIVVGDIN